MVFLTAFWLLLIQPNAGSTRIDDREFKAEQVEFSNQDDCETYAKLKFSELLTMKKRRGKTVPFPADTVATYTCVEKTR